uniref:Uncharacterized protein n=1 Tax=Anopheles atroparvus TaxID=41427 RepID=A0AAG5DC76_ANOAO
MASSVKRKVGCKWRISVVVGLIVGVCLREPTVCASEDDPPAVSYINSEAMGLKILPDLASVQLDENIPEQYRVAANGIAKLWKEHL